MTNIDLFERIHMGDAVEKAMSRAAELHDRLAKSDIRVFILTISTADGHETTAYIHGSKTTAGWRDDVRRFLDSEQNSPELSDEPSAWETMPSSRLDTYLRSLGYCEIEDVASDVYEGREAVQKARIVDDPEHEEQETGFGHYGWESKGSASN
jgi:hypothetical protein